jgi:putrescine transport system ATP-binding protein
VKDVNLEIRDKEFLVLVGPSGCGKTTTLRMVAGLESITSGEVVIGNRVVNELPPMDRDIAMVFQNYALYPHMSVYDNMAFGLKMRKFERAEIGKRVREAAEILGIEGYLKRKPRQLSGGQRQRVALARSLAKRPRVLLLDEPMAALDKRLREQTQFELMELQARLGMTFVIVTHDQAEAMTVAHRIAVMDRGRIVQAAPPAEIYEQPRSRWVAEFVGDVNLIDGRVVEAGAGVAVIADQAGRRYRVVGDVTEGAEVAIAVRPEKVRMEAEPAPASGSASGDALNAVRGRIADIGYLGGMSIYKVRLDDGTIVKATVANVARTGGLAFSAGVEVSLSWPPDAAVVLTG